jgi:DNA primase
VAELAQLTVDEMQSLLKLPILNKAPTQARPKLTRTTNSLHHHFCLTMIMQPALADKDDLFWVIGNSDDEILLRHTIETCLLHPHSKPVVIVRELENKVNAKIMADLKKELNVLDETLDLAKDLVGARKKLKHHYLQKNESVFLAQVSEKPLSLLTDDERTLLKTLGSNSKHITKE